MTPHEEVCALLRELADIAIAIDRIEAAHGPHPRSMPPGAVKRTCVTPCWR